MSGIVVKFGGSEL